MSGFEQTPHVQDLATWLLIVLHLSYPVVLIQFLHLLILDTRDLSLLGASLCNGLNISGRNAVVILLSVSTVTDLLMTSRSTSSLLLIISAHACSWQALQFLQLLHL